MVNRQRNEISAETKRTVRQRCGFGCVICGTMPYQYHHLTQWSETQDDSAENLVILCSSHHDEITRKILSNDTIRHFAVNPHNLRLDRSPGRKHFLNHRIPKIRIGGNKYAFDFNINPDDTFYPIVLHNNALMEIQNEDGFVLINIHLRDKLGKTLFKIDRGELSVTTQAWDCETSGRSVIIRNRPREILLDFSFEEDGLSINRFLYSINKSRISITKSGIFHAGQALRLTGNTFLSQIGVCFGPPRIVPCGSYFEFNTKAH